MAGFELDRYVVLVGMFSKYLIRAVEEGNEHHVSMDITNHSVWFAFFDKKTRLIGNQSMRFSIDSSRAWESDYPDLDNLRMALDLMVEPEPDLERIAELVQPAERSEPF